MAIGGRGVTVRVYEDVMRSGEIEGAILRELQRAGQIIAQGAKRRAPVSPRGSNGRRSGYGRSQIRYELGTANGQHHVDIATPATSPEGFPYMAHLELTGKRPHLRIALDDYTGP